MSGGPEAPPVPAGIDVSALAGIALEVATGAADLVAGASAADRVVASTKTSAVDVVTAMDQRSQDHLRAELARLRPDDGFHGEEEGGHTGTTGVTWVVDPIDGTVNYLYGIPAWSVSVAAVVGDPTVRGAWRPVAGAVIDPLGPERFAAALGRGARRWGPGDPTDGPGRPISVSGATDLSTSLVGTGFGYDARRRAWQAAVLAHVLPQVRDIRRLGSAALDLCHVASGRLDAYWERGLHPWDMAAAWLVVTEAGGAVDDAQGGAPGNAMTLAAAPGVHPALVAAVAEAAATVAPDEAPVLPS